jgi:hypothetical protein
VAVKAPNHAAKRVKSLGHHKITIKMCIFSILSQKTFHSPLLTIATIVSIATIVATATIVAIASIVAINAIDAIAKWG